MFVTSDVRNPAEAARAERKQWREYLLGGICIHGSSWAGYQAMAKFYLEAASRCGVLEEMPYASYGRPGDKRMREIKPASFEKLARGELVGARNADRVLLRGNRWVTGIGDRQIWLGGEGGCRRRGVATSMGPRYFIDYPYRAFDASFVYPAGESLQERAIDLLNVAVDLLDAEYGYFFIRDEYFFPSGYAAGMGSVPLELTPADYRDNKEISDWAHFTFSGRMWTEKWPMMRDLFAVNLISERHTATPIEGIGYLTDWITAEAGRGRLVELGRGRLLWILADAELIDVRPRLNEAGLLFSCYPRVYRDLPVGPDNPGMA
jgi:hypothetical protein